MQPLIHRGSGLSQLDYRLFVTKIDFLRGHFVLIL